jgi:pantetheine-phosphate adenylyltransferase
MLFESSMTSRVAIYPGSFDPITNGHVDLIQRSLAIFDRLIIAVAINPRKTPLFSVPERLDLIRASLSPEHLARVDVDSFEGLLVQYAKRIGASVLVRGLRAVSDFEFEFQMANMNRHLDDSIETMFMMTGEEAFYISSSFVREVALFGGSVEGMVPDAVNRKLTERFPRQK